MPSDVSDPIVNAYLNPVGSVPQYLFRFTYRSTFNVAVMFLCDPFDPLKITGIESVKVASVLGGRPETYKPDKSGHMAPYNYFDPGARMAGKPGYHNPNPSLSKPRIPRRPGTLTHQVHYEHSTGYVTCSCLANQEQRWCRAINEQIDKGVDINVVSDAVDALRNSAANKKDTIITVPVMPRAMMRLKVTKHKGEVPGDPASYVDEFLFTYGEHIRVWYEPNMSLRSLVAEAFALVRASEEMKRWTEYSEKALALVRTNGMQRIRVKCNNRWHNHNKDNLFNEMIGERAYDQDPNEVVKNVAYVAMLNAFYDLFEGRCYACFVGFNPAEDVPKF